MSNPTRTKKILKWVIGIPVGFVLLLLVIGLFAPKDKAKAVAKESTTEHTAPNEKGKTEESDGNEVDPKELAELRADTLLTNYVNCERFLKSKLKDPDSYEEIEHQSYYVNQEKKEDPYMQVKIKYRAKNSFGGYVVSTRWFDFDSKGQLTKTFEDPK